MADIIIHNVLLYFLLFLRDVQFINAQFFNPSVDPGTAYYTTYMLCTQTPVEYRISCRRNTDCPVPNLTTCIGSVCCAKDQISLQAISVYKLMAKDKPGVNSQNKQGSNTNNNRMNNERNQNGGNQNPRFSSTAQSQAPKQQQQQQQQQRQQQQQQQRQQQQQQQRQQQKGTVPQIPTIQFKQIQGGFQQRFSNIGQTMARNKPSERVSSQNLIQEKQPRIVIQDTIGMANSLSSGTLSKAKEDPVGKSVLSSQSDLSANSPFTIAKSASPSQISHPSGSNFVTELTADQAAKRRAHMQNANKPELRVSQTVPNNAPPIQRNSQTMSTRDSQSQRVSSSSLSNQQASQTLPSSSISKQNGGKILSNSISSVQMNNAGGNFRPDAPSTNSAQLNSQIKASASAKTPMECDDIAIIGAGISGTYTAWRLRQSKLKVSVYEETDRIGGRIFTYRFREAPDINVELGAMTFSPDKDKRVSKVINELRLPVIDFKNGWDNEDSTLYYLREVHMTYNDLGGMSTPYNLREHELKTPDMLRRYLSSSYTNSSGNIDTIENELFNIITNDGVPLYQQSYSEAFAKMGSGEASTYLRDQSGFHCTGGASSAVLGIPKGNPSLNITGRARIQTVAGGMDLIPKSFMKAFLTTNSRNKYNPNNKLLRIKREIGNKYTLHFTKTETVNGKTKKIENSALTTCAKSVILTQSRKRLNDIEWKTFKEEKIKSVINSVFDCPVCKLYLVYDFPWWKSALRNYTQTKTDLPLRRTFDYGVSGSTGKAVLLVSFSDGNDVSYWRQLQSHGRKIGWRYDFNAVTEHVVNHAHIHLSYVYNISMNDIPAPRDGSMMIWDDGWSTWKPGVIWPDVRRQLLRPTPHENIFIVPSYYGTYNHKMWSLEGAFESADAVLNLFGLPIYA